jgi:integrase
MRTVPSQIETQGSGTRPFGPRQLLTAADLCAAIGVTPGWVYTRTKKGAIDPLPVFRLSGRTIRFDPDKISAYLWTRERHRTDATLKPFDGIARVNGKGKCILTRKRFQTGSVRLGEDRGPSYWEGSYREDVVNEAGKTVRRRRDVNLGSLAEVKTEKAAQQKLAVILEPINDAKQRPKKMMTFRGFIEKYRTLKLANKKGTTVHGYETNIRAHYLPEFGMQLSEISIEAVQAFINQKAIEGKAVQTLKNFKWGLSSIFVATIKYGYITSNPARGVDLPPEPVKERKVLPTGNQLNRLIQRLEDPISEAVWLVSISCVRPEELAFKWIDLDAKKRDLWVVRAVNRGKLHTPKYHRSNRPIRLTQADVERLLALKARVKAKDDDWVFPNSRKTGPIWHEDLLSRRIQPVADELCLPHITWRHWGATQMVEERVPIKAAQERLGHSRPDILLKFYAHVLDASADMAAETLSGQFGGGFSAPMAAHATD